jgi:hypothetical protein
VPQLLWGWMRLPVAEPDSIGRQLKVAMSW